MDKKEYDVTIIGGGFFGCALALHFKKTEECSVLLLEKEPDLLQRASYANQARVHNGYHYPRSMVTALRSRVNFPRFVKDFKECIVDDFEKYYAIALENSKVTARQFKIFCERIGAPAKIAPKNIKRIFNSEMVEEVFSVHEYAFDAVKLKEMVWDDMQSAGVEIKLGARAEKLEQADGGKIRVTYSVKGAEKSVLSGRVFNCTYSEINRVLANSGLPLIPLKHELTEMALIEVPEEIKNLGITMMCGPFFSTMPFPPRKLHTLSHVRYTPHHEWRDEEGGYMDAHEYFAAIPKVSKYAHMIKDVERFIPCMKDSKYVDSIWEVKTVLPLNEVDDGRPILFKKDHGIKNLTCVMGGKIDNIYDVLTEIGSYKKQR